MTVLSKKQVKNYGPRYYEKDGESFRITATARHDDRCNNGHNTFSIVGEVERKLSYGRWGEGCSGCIHDLIGKYFPELAHMIKWHLCSTDGPMYYITNTVYQAGDRDHWGLRKGEKEQIKKGGEIPVWTLVLEDGRDARADGIPKTLDAYERPPSPAPGLRYTEWYHIGEGKERDLDAARETAIWPEATDEELTRPGLVERLKERLPALMEEFRRDVESLGFTY